jgi:hypothetical protein
MNTFLRRACVSLLVLTAATATATPPDPAMVTSGADIQQLRFDWNYVPRAGWYELWFRANDGSAWTKFLETPSNHPHARIRVSTHLLDWQQARYNVHGCNPSGCTPSSDVAVGDLMLDTIGYFKPTVTQDSAYFGTLVKISEDGQTLVALASDEPVTVANAPTHTVRLYVYRKVNLHWTVQARLTPSHLKVSGNNESPALSISRDGSVIALGLPSGGEDGAYPYDYTGAVHVFRRSGTAWSEEQRILPGTDGHFLGYMVRLNEAGDAFVAGIGGPDQVWAYQHGASGWTRTATVAARPASGCSDPSVSGNLALVANVCHATGSGVYQLYVRNAVGGGVRDVVTLSAPNPDYEVSGPLLDFTGDTVAMNFVRRFTGGTDTLVQIVHRSAGAYGSATILRPAAWTDATQSFFQAQALSRDASYLAVSDAGDTGAGFGVLKPPLAHATQRTGALYLYQNRGGRWTVRSLLKSPRGDSDFFGPNAADFGEDGRALAVGESSESSAATRIDGDRNDTSRLRSGAVWLY